MALNYIWIFFFLIAFVTALIKLIFFGDVDIFSNIITAIFDMSKTGFEISIGLTGVLSLWMGVMKIGEDSGVVRIFSKALSPFLTKLFPELGDNHPAYGSIVMNIAANMLGLDNAATPMGLKAMEQMQSSNSNKDVASNSQIMFLVLNTSGLTIIPVSIMVYRSQMGAADPSDIFLPILLATFISTIVGIVSVSIYQKINLLNRTILTWLVGSLVVIGAVIFMISGMDKEQIALFSKVTSNLILFSIIISFIGLGAYKKINVYESFINGAKDGFAIAIKIIPYLIAVLIAIGAFRASGALTTITEGISALLTWLGVDNSFVEALPTALMKPLSGSGARGMMVECMQTHGADSFVARVASTVQGSTDTTFYIIAVYFGSVGIKRSRYAVTCGLIADFAGIIAAILMAYLFFA